MSLSVACIGGGPGGLLLATLVKRAVPDAVVTLYERNRPDDTFGFGVVFSDATLAGIEAADPDLRDAMDRIGQHWDDIEVRLKGERWRCEGNGMTAIRRTSLLATMQDNARAAGVDLRFETEVSPVEVADADVIVACDGANSGVRESMAERFEPRFETASAKFIWFGTTYQFTGLTFVHSENEHGTFAVHGYPIGDGLSTFIVETDEGTWKRAGLDKFDVGQPPGVSDAKSQAYLERLFADQIDGHPLVANSSRWSQFRTRSARRWVWGNVALLGDAAHTAHFSVGSGTKMAMEDAIVLADMLTSDHDDPGAALQRYETTARPPVDRIQASAGPSLSWWEHFGRYHAALEPWQFSAHFLTRSMTLGRLARRAPGYVETIRGCWSDAHGASPLSTPLTVSDEVTLAGRVLAPDACGGAILADSAGTRLPIGRSDPGDGPWIGLVDAPDHVAMLPAAVERMRALVDAGASIIAVDRGGALSRTLLAEEARWGLGIPVARVEPDADDDIAESLVLSGRTDVVVRAYASAGPS